MASYPIPPWLQPQDIAGKYAQGMALGARVAQQQAQLNQEADQFQMQTAVREKQFKQEMLRQQTQQETQKAYQQAEIGLRKQALDQTAQRVQVETQKAARQFAAQQNYQKLIQGGMDPAKALLAIGPEFGQALTGYAALAKTATASATAPPSVETYGGEKFLKVPGPSGDKYHPIRADQEMTKQDTARMQILMSEKRALQNEHTPRRPTGKISGANWDEEQKRLDGINKELNIIAPPKTSTGSSGGARFRYNKESGKIEPVSQDSE